MNRKAETGGTVVIDSYTIAQSIAHYGAETQKIVCMEECAELIQAISKTMRGEDFLTRTHLVEEMADVTICLEMLQQIYGIADCDLAEWIEDKQKRTRLRMEQERAQKTIPGENPGEKRQQEGSHA